MASKNQKQVNKIIKAAGGRRQIVRRSPITKTRRSWDMTKAVEAEKKKQ